MIHLKMTCGGCPEQYDAFDGDKQVGYLRLRHGGFTVHYPSCGGELIYEASPQGDGIFDPDERDYYLRHAVDAIERRMRGQGRIPAPDVRYTIEGQAEY